MNKLLYRLGKLLLFFPKKYQYSWKVKWHTTLFYFRCKYIYKNVTIGKHVVLYGTMYFKVAPNAVVNIGDHFIFRSHNRYNPIGVNRPVSIVVRDNARLDIGTHTALSGTSLYAQKSITIGEWVNFGANTNVWDTDFHPLNKELRRQTVRGANAKEIIIKKDAFIGANSTILKGATIGEGAIIGAASVVAGKIPDDEIWGGNPAGFIRKNNA